MAEEYNNQQEQPQPDYNAQQRLEWNKLDVNANGISDIRDSNAPGYRGPYPDLPKKEEPKPANSGDAGALFDLLNVILKFAMKFSYIGIGIFAVGAVLAFPYVAIPIVVGGAVGFAAYKFNQRNKAKQQAEASTREIAQDTIVITKDKGEKKSTTKDITKDKNKDEMPIIVKPISQRQIDKKTEQTKHGLLDRNAPRPSASRPLTMSIVKPKQPQADGKNSKQKPQPGSRASF